MKLAHQQPDHVMVLASGRVITVTPEAEGGVERVEIRSPTGELEVSVVMTPEGPRLRIRALDIDLDAARSLRMRCQTLAIDVEQDAGVNVGGHFTEKVGGNVLRHAEGQTTLHGADVAICAPRGQVSVRANDDLDLKGERILLNADGQPMALTWEEFHARTRRPNDRGNGP